MVKITVFCVLLLKRADNFPDKTRKKASRFALNFYECCCVKGSARRLITPDVWCHVEVWDASQSSEANSCSICKVGHWVKSFHFSKISIWRDPSLRELQTFHLSRLEERRSEKVRQFLPIYSNCLQRVCNMIRAWLHIEFTGFNAYVDFTLFFCQ